MKNYHEKMHKMHIRPQFNKLKTLCQQKWPKNVDPIEIHTNKSIKMVM